ncbi:MAG: hypothetical protein M1331_03515 [Candidatus Marsarchaeota archaeon]|nr:hypothetical protein [Candidatus Marsarchaeota archaeon]MCL5106435.1 hypothetical protein [Candidatus Marsarchaeota archaeon]
MESNKTKSDYNFERLSKVISPDGTTMAHRLAQDGNLPRKWMTKEVISLADSNGKNIASMLAYSDALPHEHMTLDILRMPSYFSYFKNTIAHSLTNYKCNRLPEKRMTAEILSLANENLSTPAHNLAAHGNLPRRFQVPEILGIKDKFGISVGDELNNYKNANPELCKKVDKFLIRLLRI